MTSSYYPNHYNSERIHNNNANSDSDKEALQIFNGIKETYARKIEELNELKRQVFLITHHD